MDPNLKFGNKKKLRGGISFFNRLTHRDTNKTEKPKNKPPIVKKTLKNRFGMRWAQNSRYATLTTVALFLQVLCEPAVIVSSA